MIRCSELVYKNRSNHYAIGEWRSVESQGQALAKTDPIFVQARDSRCGSLRSEHWLPSKGTHR
jgi:hypothetical protein